MIPRATPTVGSPARPGPTARVRARRVQLGAAGTAVHEREEVLATEEPLEIRLDDRSFSVTMRTPGSDVELAAGLLHGEGIVRGPDDVVAIRYCTDPGVEQRYNVVTVDLAPHVRVDWDRLRRLLVTTSACGVCGTGSLEALRERGIGAVGAGPVLDAELVAGLPDRLRAGQRLFERTGGLHAAGLFDPSGVALAVREDVGRHNAVDKVVGWALLQGRLPLAGCVLAVSGRTSYEIVQKAVAAGIPAVVGVSAPSSLAVATAAEFGATLVGFAREGRFTVYAGQERVSEPAAVGSDR